MGNKVNSNIFRSYINLPKSVNWFEKKNKYNKICFQDQQIREFLLNFIEDQENLEKNFIEDIVIYRSKIDSSEGCVNLLKVIIYVSKFESLDVNSNLQDIILDKDLNSVDLDLENLYNEITNYDESNLSIVNETLSKYNDIDSLYEDNLESENSLIDFENSDNYITYDDVTKDIILTEDQKKSRRFYFLYNITKIINNVYGKESKVSILIKPVKTENSADLISKEIAFKLLRRLNIKLTVNSIIKRVKKDSNIKGIKIILSGKLSNEEKAVIHKFNFGALKLQSLSSNVKYSYTNFVNIDGVIGIKVWITYKNYYE